MGAAVAALLAADRLTSHLRVAVLDVRAQPTRFRPGPVPEARVSTVTPGSIAVLQRAGAWEEAEAHSAAFDTMQVWDSAAPGHIWWDARDVGAERMGVVAENTLLQASLLAAVERSGGRTELLWPAELRALRLPPEEGGGVPGVGQQQQQQQEAGHSLAELELSDGRVLPCRLVVAADGVNSRVRQLAGLRTWGWGYGQRGLVATVETDVPNTTAWQRFLPTGPLALLPVRGGRSNVVWSTTPDAARALEGASSEDFAAAVNKVLRDPPANQPPAALAGALGSLASLTAQVAGGGGSGGGAYRDPPLVTGWVGSSPKSFPLQLKQAGRYVLPRLALVGDAAHAVHPLAGQGVNLGFGDAGALAEALRAAVESGTDPGDARHLAEAYEGPRRQAVMSMVAALDGIKQAFQVQAPPFAALRGLGLGLLNAVPPVKNRIMHYAMMGQV